MVFVHRLHQLVYVASILVLSWLGMLAVHELGHVVGAMATQGTVQRVVLHPLAISRTDVSPNPSPLIVVWLGPLIGCGLPALICLLIPKRFISVRQGLLFFAGFCLVTNGAYILFGSFDGVGDCGVMLQHGSPFWTLIAFGIVAIPSGTLIWHRLGSVREFVENPERIDPIAAWTLLAVGAVVLVAEMLLFPA